MSLTENKRDKNKVDRSKLYDGHSLAKSYRIDKIKQ